MADTGAPWSIPYAEPADLVRDWPALSEDVADAVAAGLDTRRFGQIVQTIEAGTFSTQSGTYQEVFTVAITPVSATNKVLLVASVPMGFATGGAGGSPTGMMSIFRATTNLAVPTSPGSRTPAMHEVVGASSEVQVASFMFLDSPSTTSATTYSVRVRAPGNGASTVFVNRSQLDDNAAGRSRTIASLTAIEVLA